MTSAPSITICILLVLCYVVFANGQSNDFPSLQYVKTYQSHAVITSYQDDSKTPSIMFVAEFHDRDQKIGRIDVRSKGKEKKHFYYMKEDKAATVIGEERKYMSENDRPGNCTVTDIDTFIIEEGFQLMANKENDLIGPSALFLPRGFTPKNEGTKDVRGISCSKWTFDDEKANTKYSVVLYLSDKNWNSTGLETPFEEPVRIEANLTMENKTVRAIVDFTYFIINQTFEFETTFLVPLGIGCESLGRDGNQGNNLQDSLTSEIMSFYTDQIYDTGHKTGSFRQSLREVLDWKNNIWQYEGAAREVNYVYHTFITEFDTGVQYVIKKDGSCRIVPIFNGVDLDKAWVYEWMNSMNSVFHLNYNYSYLGKEYQRGIFCDVYEAIVTQKPYDKIVYTYFVADRNYVSDMDLDDSRRTVVMERRTYYWNISEDEGLTIARQEEYDFFNVRHLKSNKELKNIDACFSAQTQKNYFALHFQLDKPEMMEMILSQSEEFEKKARDLIISNAGISALRLPYLKVHAESKSATLLGRMLNRPPFILGFLDFPPDEVDKNVISKNKESEEDCAVECLAMSFENCGSFHHCPDKCYYNPYDGVELVPIVPKNCHLFRRTTGGITLNGKTLDVALKNLNKAVGKKAIAFTMKAKNGVEYRLEAKSMQQDLNPLQIDKGDNKKYEAIFEGHELDLSTYSNYQIPDAIGSVDECYKKCKDQFSMYCAGFSYCYPSNKCRITSSNLRLADSNIKDEIEIATSCTVFRIKAIEFFQEFPGKIPIGRGDATVYAATPDDCARQCRDATQFPCEGFEFCERDYNPQCILHKQHILDASIPSDNVTMLCKYYFLDYGASFVTTGGVLVMDPNGIKLKGKEFSECARMCFTLPELHCQSFNFCPQEERLPSECHISTVKITDHVDTVSSDQCQHYEMAEEKHFPTTTSSTTITTQSTTTKTTPSTTTTSKPISSPTPDKGTTTSTSISENMTSTVKQEVTTELEQTIVDTIRTGVSPSTFTGAVVGMLIFGIVAGILGFLVYSYYRSRRTDSGITVHFTKENL